MRLKLGGKVHCSDGDARELADVVIDPGTRSVTHLVIEPHDRPDMARLVPVDRARVSNEGDDAIALDCTAAEVDQLESVHTASYLRIGEQPETDPDWQVGIEDITSMPYSGGFGPGGIDAGVGPTDYDPHVTASYDRIPKGEVEIRRGSPVTSAQGDHVGHVDGFQIDDDHRITHFLLEHGHFWGKREVLIPMQAVARIENDEVLLTISKDEVGR
jgi:sporulation protein YlmC with PRC-barrel domain